MNQETNRKLLADTILLSVIKGDGSPPVIDPAPHSILRGHTSPESAVYVSSYPYGSLRCIMRYWIETSPKHGARLCSQTNNPKRPGLYWNAPKKATYIDGIMVMVTNEKAHVHYDALTTWDCSNQYPARGYDVSKVDTFAEKYAEALTDDDRVILKGMRLAMERYNDRQENQQAAA